MWVYDTNGEKPDGDLEGLEGARDRAMRRTLNTILIMKKCTDKGEKLALNFVPTTPRHDAGKSAIHVLNGIHMRLRESNETTYADIGHSMTNWVDSLTLFKLQRGDLNAKQKENTIENMVMNSFAMELGSSTGELRWPVEPQSKRADTDFLVIDSSVPWGFYYRANSDHLKDKGASLTQPSVEGLMLATLRQESVDRILQFRHMTRSNPMPVSNKDTQMSLSPVVGRPSASALHARDRSLPAANPLSTPKPQGTGQSLPPIPEGGSTENTPVQTPTEAKRRKLPTPINLPGPSNPQRISRSKIAFDRPIDQVPQRAQLPFRRQYPLRNATQKVLPPKPVDAARDWWSEVERKVVRPSVGNSQFPGWSVLMAQEQWEKEKQELETELSQMQISKN